MGVRVWQCVLSFITTSLLTPRTIMKSCILRTPGRFEYFLSIILLQSKICEPSSMHAVLNLWQISRSSSTHQPCYKHCLSVKRGNLGQSLCVHPLEAESAMVQTVHVDKFPSPMAPWPKKRGNDFYLCSQHCQGKCMHI